MSERILFERVLESLHEAALDDAYWPATSGLIDEACGSKGNSLIFGTGQPPDDIDLFFFSICHRGQLREDLKQEYLEDYYAVDERVPRVRLLADSHLVHTSSLYTDEEMKTSPAYNEALPKTEGQNSLNVRLDGPDGSRIALNIFDPIDGSGWSSVRVKTIKRLLPHLRQFVRVRQTLVNACALGSSLAALLEQTNLGVIWLDRRGRIVAANDRARDVLRGGDGLADRDRLLHAVSSKDDAALQNLLARVLPPFGGRGVGGSITVRRGIVSPRLVLHAVPLEDQRMDGRPSGVAALVLVVDPASRGRVDPALVRAMLGLTPAESQVAVMLAQGYTIRNIAAATERGEGTIRWHTKQIFGKLGVSSQMELVQLVLSLSDLPQAPR